MENKTKGITAIIFATILIASVFAVTPTAQAATQTEINAAIAAGVPWLAAQQNLDGSWGADNDKVARTGLAVLKLETYAIEQGLSPFDTNYLYHQNVEDGLDYIFSKAIILSGPLTSPHGNPDPDGDGGVYFYDTTSSHQNYETGIALMAISASDAPTRTVNVAGSAVDTWTYQAVAQDIVDFFAYGQVDSPCGDHGGWSYSPNQCGIADNSNSGYVLLGLGYAQASSPWGFGLTVPAFVRSELNSWIGAIQDPVNGDTDDGGSWYRTSWSWVNILKTGNLLYEMEFFGDNPSTPRVQDAVDYIERHWNDPNMDPGWRDDATTSDYQGMYTTMKGLEALGIDTITVGGSNVDWFDDFTNEIVAEQDTTNGYWSGCRYGDNILCTAWALLTLEKAVPPTWLTLSPASDTNPLGTSHELTAILVDENGVGIVGETITFTVTAGPHIGTSGTGDTNADGEATWSYTGTSAGTDTISATGAGKTSNDAFKEWGDGDLGDCCVCPGDGNVGDPCVCTQAGDQNTCEDQLNGVWAPNGCVLGTTQGCEGNICTGDGGCEIPEFSTIAIPVATILGLLFFFNYRKRKREQ